MPTSVLKHPLHSHPAVPAPAGLAVAVHRLAADEAARPLRLRFELAGDMGPVRWPAPLGPGEALRRDGLWRHTCFEAFLAVPAGAGNGYVEYNFSPSGAWAVYRFDGYRQGMRPEPVLHEPRISVRRDARCTQVEVAIAWPVGLAGPVVAAAAGVGAAARLRLGLTAVLEAADGALSYWALRHPDGRPDFHNDAGFLLEVEVPG